jgi:hypothetical protein
MTPSVKYYSYEELVEQNPKHKRWIRKSDEEINLDNKLIPKNGKVVYRSSNPEIIEVIVENSGKSKKCIDLQTIETSTGHGQSITYRIDCPLSTPFKDSIVVYLINYEGKKVYNYTINK